MIDLRRITSPQLSQSTAILQAVWRDLSSDRALDDDLRRHRRLGSAADLAAARTYLEYSSRPDVPEDRIFLANGTWNVLFLLFETFVGRGNSVAVEASTYSQVRDVARILDIRLIPVAMDDDGLIPAQFEKACRMAAPKLLYCVPNAQNPTASILPLQRRMEIADIARRHGVVIVEDDPQGPIREDFPPPFSHLAGDIAWTVIGMSKCFFVGARVAYVVAPSKAAIEHVMARFGAMAMWYVSAPSAAFLTRAIETGAAGEILKEIRRESASRRQRAVDLLPTHCLGGIGALHLWLRSRVLSGDRLQHSAEAEGVLVRSGSEFVVEQGHGVDGIRVSLADASFEDVEEGLRRLAHIISNADGIAMNQSFEPDEGVR